jgi:hypothetical protein
MFGRVWSPQQPARIGAKTRPASGPAIMTCGETRPTRTAGILTFSWLTKPFESRKIKRRNIDLCFPFSHHEQTKNIVRRFLSGLVR